METIFAKDAPLKIAIVVGEASGDLLGAHLMQSVLAVEPGAQFAGIGGSKMNALGFKSLYPQEALAVRGLAEVIKRLPLLFKIRKGVFKQLSAAKPDIFIGIDAPDFTLTLESWFKKCGVPTIHYVSPSVWAWRGNRVRKIVQQTDEVLCLFPMEAELYRRAGGQAAFVGHPLAQTIEMDPSREAMRQQLSLPGSAPVFTVMPGSRVSEIDYMAPVFIKTVKLLLARYPDAQFLVPLATLPTLTRFKEILTEQKGVALPLRILNGHAQMAMIAADVVLVTSGTATLEVALCKRAMVISYKISWLTYLWVKHKIKSAFVGLPNILLGKGVVPELLQKDATPEKLCEAVEELFEDKNRQEEIHQDFTLLHQSLLADTAQQVVSAVLRGSRYLCK